MQSVQVEIQRLRPNTDGDLKLPSYATPYAAGMDIAAALNEDLCLEPGQRMLIPTGFAMAIPHGYELQVRPRSGLAVKHGITVLNSPGTIDSDYRGEVKICLINLGQDSFVFHRGDRIAQLILAPVSRGETVEVQTLDTTDRGSGGFGHTGI